MEGLLSFQIVWTFVSIDDKIGKEKLDNTIERCSDGKKKLKKNTSQCLKRDTGIVFCGSP